MKRLTCCLALILVFTLGTGCQKKIKLAPEEAAKREIIVMFYGEQECLSYSMERALAMAGGMGVLTGGAGGALAITAEYNIAKAEGSKLEGGLPDYQPSQRAAQKIMAQLMAAPNHKITAFCSATHGIKDNCVTAESYSELKAKYPGRLVLVVYPWEYGLRTLIPYWTVMATLYDVDSDKAVWNGMFSLKNKEINVSRSSTKEWLADPARYTEILDKQLDTIGQRLSTSIDTGYKAADNEPFSVRIPSGDMARLKQLSDHFNSK